MPIFYESIYFLTTDQVRAAFSRIIGAAPALSANRIILKAAWLDSPLGSMMTVADDKGLYLLEFIDKRNLAQEVTRLCRKTKAVIVPGETSIIERIKKN